MKIFKRIIIFFLIFITFFIIFSYLLIKFKGKEILVNKITEVSKRKTEILELKPSLPLNIYIKDLKIEGLFNVEEAYLSFSPLDLFKKFKFSSVRLVKPTFILNLSSFKDTDKNLIQQKTEEKILEEQPLKEKIPPQPQMNSFNKNKEFNFIIQNLIVEDGTFYFIDKVKIKIENINAKAHSLNISNTGIKTALDLEGKIYWDKDNIGNLVLDGWIDNFKKNMDLNLNFENIDYAAFSEYYPPFWRPENLGVKKAFLSIFAKLNSKKNNLVIDTNLVLENIEFIEDFEDTSKIKYLKTVLSLFKSDKGKPELNFRINTKMDSPKLDFSDVDLKGVVKFAPTYIVDRAIEKTKDNISKNLKTVKTLTLDNFLNIIKQFINTVKDFTRYTTDKSNKEVEKDIDIKSE